MIALAHPWLMALLPLPWLVWRFAPPHRERTAAIRVPFFRDIVRAAGIEPRAGAGILSRGRLQIGAAILVWVLTVLALARPERLGEPVVIERAARDVVLALDISGSMDARDFVAEDGTRQQRLSAVKAVIAGFIADRDKDRMALIVFGSRAFVQAPFTEDLASLEGFLDQTEVGMAGPNTALGDAIGLAVRTFEASDIDERVLILLSDGADTGSRMSPVNAATIAADRGVRIYAIGVGDPAAAGDARVDLDALDRIARATGGQSFFAGDGAALAEVYASIDALTPRAAQSQSFRPREDLAYLPLGAALIVAISATLILHLRHRGAA